MKVKCVREKDVTLSFITPAENLDQLEMHIGDNEPSQSWRNKNDWREGTR